MIRRQIPRPRKRVGHGRLAGADRDACAWRGAAIIHGVGKVDGPASAIGCNMKGSRVGDSHLGAASHAHDACRTHRHVNACHFEGRR